VRDALLVRGVPAVQLEVLGYGANRPLADNATEAGRAANRRIEFKALP
jgi:outer membrane protein OmpA-like peptidoglycan-associated protein